MNSTDQIVMINPGSGSYDHNLNATSSTPNLGLLYVAASLIDNGYSIEPKQFIDQPVRRLSDENLINKIKRIDPTHVLFSVLIDESRHSGNLAARLKKELPDVKIIFGGPQATLCHDKIMNNYQVDYCIRGPGEDSVVQLLNGKDYDQIPGLVYRENSLVKSAAVPAAPMNNDIINSLPFPARELINKDMNKYGSISGFKLKNCGSIISSRGCPFNCTYCSCSELSDRRVAFRNVENVIQELELMDSQGYENVIFFDDSLTLSKKRTIDLSNKIRQAKLGIDWIFEGRVDPGSSTKEMFKSMVKSGCKMAYFGVESGVERVLKSYNKGTNPLIAAKAIKNARESGIEFIDASFILGAPGETVQELEQTINFIKRLAENYVDFFQITELMAYPGTILWNDLVSKGYFNPDDCWETGALAAEVYHRKNPGSVSPELLRQKLIEAYKSYLYDKKYMARFVYRIAKSKWMAKQALNNGPYIAFGKGTLFTKLTGLPDKDDWAGLRKAINKTILPKLFEKLSEKLG